MTRRSFLFTPAIPFISRSSRFHWEENDSRDHWKLYLDRETRQRGHVFKMDHNWYGGVTERPPQTVKYTRSLSSAMRWVERRVMEK